MDSLAAPESSSRVDDFHPITVSKSQLDALHDTGLVRRFNAGDAAVLGDIISRHRGPVSINILEAFADAASAHLKTGFTDHPARTSDRVMRLTESHKILSLPAEGKSCHAMLGLIEEGGEAIAWEGPPAVREAALIGAALRVEHYEIAGYGTARAFAHVLGENQIADLLQATLDEEGDANKRLTEIAGTVNAAALSPGGQISPAKKTKKQLTHHSDV